MALKPIKTLSPFKKFCVSIGELPTSYLESLTYYELLEWLINYLQTEVIPAVNQNGEAVAELQELFIKLQEFVTNYFDNLDVQEEINNKLDKMVEDGTLINLLKKYVAINDVNYLKTICMLPYRPSSSVHFGLQGGCYCGDGNIASYFLKSNTIQIISLDTGHVLREANFPILNHGNSIIKVDDYLYICGTGDNNNDIYRVPYPDLNECIPMHVFDDGGIPTGSNISSLTYNKINNHFYLNTFPLFPTTTIFEIDKNFKLVNTFIIDNDSNNFGGYNNDILYWNGYIGLLFNEGKLNLYIPETMELYKTITIDKNSGSNYCGEFEWIDTYNDNEIIVGVIGDSGGYDKYGSGNYFFAKCNLYNSTRDYPYIESKDFTRFPLKTRHIYVDNTVEFNSKANGTRLKPFTSIYQAMNSTFIDGYDKTFIYITGTDYLEEGLFIWSRNNITFVNNNNTLINFREISIEYSNNIYLSNIYAPTLINNNSNTTVQAQLYNENNPIKITNSISSILKFNGANNGLYFNEGESYGELLLTSYTRVNGTVGLLNSDGSYTTFIKSRCLKNMRNRVRHKTYTPTNTLKFKVNECEHRLKIALLKGSDVTWLDIPSSFTTVTNKYYVGNPDNDVITINSVLSSNQIEYTLTTTSGTLADGYVIY